jgi:hypothetical protein
MRPHAAKDEFLVFLGALPLQANKEPECEGQCEAELDSPF